MTADTSVIYAVDVACNHQQPTIEPLQDSAERGHVVQTDGVHEPNAGAQRRVVESDDDGPLRPSVQSLGEMRQAAFLQSSAALAFHQRVQTNDACRSDIPDPIYLADRRHVDQIGKRSPKGVATIVVAGYYQQGQAKPVQPQASFSVARCGPIVADVACNENRIERTDSGTALQQKVDGVTKQGTGVQHSGYQRSRCYYMQIGKMQQAGQGLLDPCTQEGLHELTLKHEEGDQ